jgi:Permuted papain-like amidase enzyme, YaeF/YiiX, C92 family
MLPRRGFLVSLATGVFLPTAAHAQNDGNAMFPLPNPQTFQSGDLVWPKKPGAFVPYRSGSSTQLESDQSQWQRERQEFLTREAGKSAGRKSLSDSELESIRRLDFREFHARYAGDQRPGVPGAYATGGGVYVGHVGIIEMEANGSTWVIEAIWGKGVIRQSYSDWLRGRPGEVVWHGRLRDLAPEARTAVALEARKHVGKKYDFWNFDLSDDSGFYCSKLVWLAIMKTQGFAVDGNPDPRRGFWLSPKQVLYSKPVARLHDPGPYAN